MLQRWPHLSHYLWFFLGLPTTWTLWRDWVGFGKTERPLSHWAIPFSRFLHGILRIDPTWLGYHVLILNNDSGCRRWLVGWYNSEIRRLEEVTTQRNDGQRGIIRSHLQYYMPIKLWFAILEILDKDFPRIDVFDYIHECWACSHLTSICQGVVVMANLLRSHSPYSLWTATYVINWSSPISNASNPPWFMRFNEPLRDSSAH